MSCWSIVFATAAIAMSVNVVRADIPSGAGVLNPTMAFNLAAVADSSTEMPFLDIVHTMRPWVAAGMSYSDIVSGGYLDGNGWLKSLPSGVSSVSTIWDWGNVNSLDPEAAASRAGVYVLSYEGQGTIKMTLGARVLSSEPGRIVFENVTGAKMGFSITSTDPQHTGDYIHDISVVPEKYEGLAATGELFNPDWLPVVDDARELRFMDWMRTNTSSDKDWSDRPQMDDASWMTDGVPIEAMVQLANQTGTDPWFSIPVAASDDYIRQFATYVRDHLDPSLKVHVEYGNENWNSALHSYGWLADQSQALWGTKSPIDYAGMRATQTALIWDQVFGDHADVRVENVLGTQTANSWIASRLLTSPTWLAHDPDHYVDPASVFDALAVTTYFGGDFMKDADLRNALLNAIHDPTIDVSTWLYNGLLDPSIRGSIPYIENLWAQNKVIADQNGLDLIAYEGGQHVLHSFSIKGISPDDMATLTNFLSDFVRGPRMVDLYTQLWNAWAEVSNGPFMQYNDVGQATKFGAWGLYDAIGDTNPRAELIERLNATTPSWFGDGGSNRYLQGVIKIASDAGETITGTDKQDFLIGGNGDDTLIPGQGQDAINGGAGNDIVLLPGERNEFRIAPNTEGYQACRNRVCSLIINVEKASFTDQTDLPLGRP